MASALQLVIDHDHKPATTSLLVARKFNREHKNVLASIEGIECTPHFRALNFKLSSYRSLQNKDLPMFIITRDGFTMLMMTFQGDAAMKFREDYIAEFNRMEAELKTFGPTLLPTYSARILSEPSTLLPEDYWSVFNRSHFIMFFIEKHIGSVNKYDLADGSIGIHWGSFRKGKQWVKPSKMHPHHFGDQRKSPMCNCYHEDEGKIFDAWLMQVYKNKHMIPYLKNKFRTEGDVTMLKRVENLEQKGLN